MMNLKCVTALWVLLVALVSIGLAAPSGIDVKVGFTGPDGQGNLRTTDSAGVVIQEIGSDGTITQLNVVVTGTATFQGDVSNSNGTFSGTLDVTGATTLNGATVIDDTLTATGATVLVSTLLVEGATTLNGATVIDNTLTSTGLVTAVAGIVNETVANITPLDLTTTNGQAIANSRSVQYLVPSGALAITNTLANPARKGDYLEVHNGFATNVFILDDANIEGAGSLTLAEHDIVAYRAINTSVWRELWRNTAN